MRAEEGGGVGGAAQGGRQMESESAPEASYWKIKSKTSWFLVRIVRKDMRW